MSIMCLLINLRANIKQDTVDSLNNTNKNNKMRTLTHIIEEEEILRKNRLIENNTENLEAAIRCGELVKAVLFIEVIFCWGLLKSKTIVKEVRLGKSLTDALLDYETSLIN